MLASQIDYYLYTKNLNLEDNQGYSNCDFYLIVQFESNYRRLLFLVNELVLTKLAYFREIDSEEPAFY